MSLHSISYVYDDGLHASVNQKSQNFWYTYIEETFDQLGLRATRVEPSDAAIIRALDTTSCLVVGPVAKADLYPSLLPALQEWVNRGGTLIGFGCEGIDGIFGVERRELVRQPRDEFSLNGFFDLKPVAVAADVHSYLHPSQKLLIVSDVRGVAPRGSFVVGQYSYANGRVSSHAAITGRALGAGWAFFFAFDVPKTLWALHQGRPVDADYDGDGYYRAGDARLIGQNEEEVAYADEILFLLQNMIGITPQPFIAPLPPEKGGVADLLLYYGGDDEASTGVQVKASDFMASRGLPYHINAMWKKGQFPLTLPEAERIWANGHEVSVHYDFITDLKQPNAFTEADVTAQATAFQRTFGRRAQCSVNHCVTWTGWAEPAKWMAANGGIGDNSRFNSALPPMNPVDQIGFSFGTAFPYHFYDDWRNGNARIRFIEEPITAYEVGYRYGEPDYPMVHRAIDLAAHYHLTMDMFYHPGCISGTPACRAAIGEILSYIGRRGLRVKHLGNDALARWWHARSDSWVGGMETRDSVVCFRTRTHHAEGMMVKVPVQKRSASGCRGAGKNLVFENRYEFGQNWVYAVVPSGECEVEITVG